MPALVNFGGEDDLCHGKRLFSNVLEPSCFLPHLGRVDLYCSPLKRSRVNAPFIPQGWENYENCSKPACYIDALPDECLFEILRRVEGKRERSVAACVSKRWLLLLGTISNSDIPLSISKADVPCNQLRKTLPDLNESGTGDENCDNEQEGIFPMSEGDSICLRKCLEDKEATDIRLLAMAIGTGNRGVISELSIRGNNPSRPVTDVGLGAVAHNSPSLKVLSLWNLPSITDEGLCHIANHCPLLEKLDLCRCPFITDKGIIAITNKCPNLVCITIESCQKIGNATLQAVGRCCQNLNSASFVDLGGVRDLGVASLVSSASSNLRKIKLQHLKVTDSSLAVIGHYGREVTDLVLANLPNVTEKGFWVMGNGQGLQKLKSLVIISCGVTDLGLKAVAGGCPLLKKLQIRRCIYLSDAGLGASVAAAAGSLEYLQLEECNRISLIGVFGALLSCNLKLRSLELIRCTGVRDVDSHPTSLPPCLSLLSLSIAGCPGFGNSSLALVGKIFPNLQQINLNGLVGLNDTGLIPLIEGCHSGLAKVNLGGCINVTDLAVYALAKRHGGTLHSLCLDGCRKVTDESLLAIADSCILLDDLDVSKCAISDDGVAALASAMGIHLQVLSLSGCSNISGRSLLSLGNRSHSLVGLNLQRCSLISSSTIASLQKKMGQCDILF